MNIILLIKNLFKPHSSTKMIGITSSICPYCEEPLDKFPSRKKKCPSCKSYILVRTRPKDNKKILITENQSIIIEEQWAIKNGTHKEFINTRNIYLKKQSDLESELGRTPTEDEIKLGIASDELPLLFEAQKWGLYGSNLQVIGGIHFKQAKLEMALECYLLNFLLEINGGNNFCGVESTIKAFPPFDRSQSFANKYTISGIDMVKSKLNLTANDLEEIYDTVALDFIPKSKLPFTAKASWKKLVKELKDFAAE